MTSQDVNTSRTGSSRNPAEYPVLGILSLGQAHGYDICRCLREGIGSVWKLGKSQVYALLSRMERDGLVAHERVGQENLPAKNIFSLTPKGRDVLGAWLESPVRHVREIRLEFLTKLWFAQQQGLDCERLLIKKQLSVCREKAKNLEVVQGSSKTQIEYEFVGFRLTVIQATISWLEELLAKSKGQ